MVTRALRLNSRLGRICFEYGDHKAANSSLLRSQEVQFSVVDGQGKSHITSSRTRDMLLDGKPVFVIPIRECVVQVDRRQHHRIQIPQISAPVVIFELPDGRKAEGRQKGVKFPIHRVPASKSHRSTHKEFPPWVRPFSSVKFF